MRFMVVMRMINNQFGRRNLSNYQRSVLALELESVFSDRAKENLGKNQYSSLQISAETTPIDTRKELAKVANVSHDTIAKVKKSNLTQHLKLKKKCWLEVSIITGKERNIA